MKGAPHRLTCFGSRAIVAAPSMPGDAAAQRDETEAALGYAAAKVAGVSLPTPRWMSR